MLVQRCSCSKITPLYLAFAGQRVDCLSFCAWSSAILALDAELSCPFSSRTGSKSRELRFWIFVYSISIIGFYGVYMASSSVRALYVYRANSTVDFFASALQISARIQLLSTSSPLSFEIWATYAATLCGCLLNFGIFESTQLSFESCFFESCFVFLACVDRTVLLLGVLKFLSSLAKA